MGYFFLIISYSNTPLGESFAPLELYLLYLALDTLNIIKEFKTILLL